MQQILLKIALVLGVEVQAPVKFEGLVEPGPDSTGEGKLFKPCLVVTMATRSHCVYGLCKEVTCLCRPISLSYNYVLAAWCTCSAPISETTYLFLN